MAYLRDESDYKGLFSDCKTVKQVKEQAIKALKWRDKSIYEFGVYVLTLGIVYALEVQC